MTFTIRRNSLKCNKKGAMFARVVLCRGLSEELRTQEVDNGQFEETLLRFG
jgi:hypothetical protein